MENQKEKNWKAESKTVSLVYDMFIYVENPKEYFFKATRPNKWI